MDTQPDWPVALADMEREAAGELHVISDLSRIFRPLRTHQSGLVAIAIRALIRGNWVPREAIGLTVDQRQDNHAYGVKQLRVRVPGDPVVYRVLVAPADAPISIGDMPADEHFAEPITGEPA